MHLPRVTLMMLVIGCCIALGACGRLCPFSRDTKFPLSLKINVDTTNNFTVAGDMSVRSLSPWTYRLDEDHNRFPRIIPQAVCSHKECLNVKGEVEITMHSAPVQQEILVLRREIKDCQQSFHLEKQLVTVGCTCARSVS